MKSKLLVILSLVFAVEMQAGSATWSVHPTSNNWNTAANWTPATVPSAQTDVATFGPSSLTSITVQDHTLIGTAVAAIVFGADAPAYTITFGDGSLNQTNFDFWGGGVENLSAFEQTFVLPTFGFSNAHLTFRNSASAGDRTSYVCDGGYIYFFNSSTAGSANFVIDNGVDSGFSQGSINFVDHSTAGESTITLMPLTASTLQDPASGGSATFAVLGGMTGGNAGAFLEIDTTQGDSGTFVAGAGMAAGAVGGSIQRETGSGLTGGTFVAEGATVSGAGGGTITLRSGGNIGSSTFLINGATVAGGQGGTMQFQDTSTASSASLTINGGTNGGAGANLRLANRSTAAAALITVNSGTSGGGGGSLSLEQLSDGGTSQVAVFGNGTLKVGSHDAPGTGIGSLTGDGLVRLRANNLTVGSNDLSTTFSGTLQDTGSMTKVGTGTLTLSGASTYTGGTTVSSGILLVTNVSGSGTGSGVVSVNAGTLGGSGIMAGAVTLGANTGMQAFLAPSKGTKRPTTLTVQGTLTFNDDSTYIYQLNTKRAASDQVVANGVVIDGGAKFSFRPSGNKALAMGQVFTVINNTAVTPIAGAFHNLPEGKIIIVNGSNLQASYTGGDGNDLTLTVVP